MNMARPASGPTATLRSAAALQLLMVVLLLALHAEADSMPFAVNNGFGAYRYQNGDTYEGQWQGGAYHGHGRKTWHNGDAYEGRFQNSQRHGQGRMTFASGEVYDGEWMDDKPHGQGRIRFTSRDTFGDVSQWLSGTERHDNGRGRIAHYQPRGAVAQIWLDREESYSENMEGDLLDKRHEWHSLHGDVYEGEWRRGKRHGKGKLTRGNGQVYEGEWLDDKLRISWSSYLVQCFQFCLRFLVKYLLSLASWMWNAPTDRHLNREWTSIPATVVPILGWMLVVVLLAKVCMQLVPGQHRFRGAARDVQGEVVE